MNVTIRRALPKDLDAAYEIECASFVADERASYLAFKQRIAAFPDTFLLAEVNNKIVGVLNSGSWDNPYFDDILYKDIKAHKKDGLYQVIYGLSVMPEFRCHGIATMLIKEIINIAKIKNKKGLILSCKDELISYYEKFGFKNMGVSRSDLGNENWNDMLFILDKLQLS